jgi:hypothetical protein
MMAIVFNVIGGFSPSMIAMMAIGRSTFAPQFHEDRLVERGDGLLEGIAADRRASLVKRDAAILAAIQHADTAAADRAPREARQQIRPTRCRGDDGRACRRRSP